MPERNTDFGKFGARASRAPTPSSAGLTSWPAASPLSPRNAA
jgi:hypothetical protein